MHDDFSTYGAAANRNFNVGLHNNDHHPQEQLRILKRLIVRLLADGSVGIRRCLTSCLRLKVASLNAPAQQPKLTNHFASFIKALYKLAETTASHRPANLMVKINCCRRRRHHHTY